MNGKLMLESFIPQVEVSIIEEQKDDKTFPKLPYPYAALDVVIDEETMKEHHLKHHKKYYDNYINAIKGVKGDKDVDNVLKNLNTLPKPKRDIIRNNGGGFSNHNLFFRIMSGDGGGVPIGDLSKSIKKHFGSFASLKKEMIEKGTGQFGSGWVWLVLKNEKLTTQVTSNQDTPLSEGFTPIMGIDLWEHAYYLRYKSDRKTYLTNWWKVANWAEINKVYMEHLEKKDA